MFIHDGADGVVWAVARVGPDARQVAGMTGEAVYIWEPGRVEPVQALVFPEEHDGREHSELSSSPDGNFVLACGGHQLYCCRRGGGCEYAAQFTSHVRAPCAALFTIGPATLTEVVLANSGDHTTINVTSRPFPARRRKAERPVTFRCPADALPAGIDVHGNHYYAAKVSPDGRWFLLSARQKVVRIWHVADGRLVGQVKFRG